MWIQGKSIRHLSATQVLVAQVVQAKVSRRAEPCRHDEKVLRFQNVRGKCQDQCEFAWCRTTGKNWRAWRRNVVHSLKCLNQHDNTGFAWSQPSLVQMQTCRPRSGCKWNPWICYSYSTSLFLEPTNVCSPGPRDGFESKKTENICGNKWTKVGNSSNMRTTQFILRVLPQFDSNILQCALNWLIHWMPSHPWGFTAMTTKDLLHPSI